MCASRWVQAAMFICPAFSCLSHPLRLVVTSSPGGGVQILLLPHHAEMGDGVPRGDDHVCSSAVAWRTARKAGRQATAVELGLHPALCTTEDEVEGAHRSTRVAHRLAKHQRLCRRGLWRRGL